MSEAPHTHTHTTSSSILCLAAEFPLTNLALQKVEAVLLGKHGIVGFAGVAHDVVVNV